MTMQRIFRGAFRTALHLCGAALILAAMPGIAGATPGENQQPVVPELGGGIAGGAIVFLVGGVMLLRDRFRKAPARSASE
jgi:hypothetical protein